MTMRLIVLPDGSLLIAPAITALSADAAVAIMRDWNRADSKLRIFRDPLEVIDLRCLDAEAER